MTTLATDTHAQVDVLPSHRPLTITELHALDLAAERLDLAAARGLSLDDSIHREATHLALHLGGSVTAWAAQLWCTQVHAD